MQHEIAKIKKTDNSSITWIGEQLDLSGTACENVEWYI